MDIYEAIFYRRSVRKYSDRQLPESIFRSLNNYSEDLPKLYDIGSDVNLIEDGSRIQDVMSGIIGSYGKIRAPHYMIITSETKEGYLENVGFAFEHVVLKLAANGLGTCWIGGHVPKDKLKDISDMKTSHEPVILISFGYADGDPHRQKSEAKRKSISDITIGKTDDVWEDLLEAAKYAPSAVNLQPWRFKIEDDMLHAYSVQRSKITKLVTKNLHLLNRIDVGIALSHMKIAADNHDLDISFQKREDPPSLRKKKYITSIIKD